MRLEELARSETIFVGYLSQRAESWPLQIGGSRGFGMPQFREAIDIRSTNLNVRGNCRNQCVPLKSSGSYPSLIS